MKIQLFRYNTAVLVHTRTTAFCNIIKRELNNLIIIFSPHISPQSHCSSLSLMFFPHTCGEKLERL